MTDPWTRFHAKYVVSDSGCWLWRGTIRADGYAVFQLSRPSRQVRAHRWAFEQTHGPVPAGLVLDHFACDTRHCVNPDHVRPVTQRENVLRSATSQASQNISKTHCKRGHELPTAGSAHRHCRVCRNAQSNEWARRRREAEVRAPRQPAVKPPRRNRLTLRDGLDALVASRSSNSRHSEVAG